MIREIPTSDSIGTLYFCVLALTITRRHQPDAASTAAVSSSARVPLRARGSVHHRRHSRDGSPPECRPGQRTQPGLRPEHRGCLALAHVHVAAAKKHCHACSRIFLLEELGRCSVGANGGN